ncbi:MAG: TonB-dependent receptor, partial [Sphingomonadales bacterium]|nr:TonB-dependent receptor [Sphingomonadales bacterium]
MFTFVPSKKNLGRLSLVFSLLASTSLLGTSLAAAQSVEEVSQPVEEITVTANRISGTLDEMGSSIEVITAEDIARTQEFSMVDVLRQVSGVSMSRTGGLGAVTNIRIRGAETGQAIVILNGVKLNDLSAPGGGYNFANMFTGDVSQIEVLKGPQSTLYGSDAM